MGLYVGFVATFVALFVVAPLSALALPHVVVGEWLDFGHSIWHVP